MAEDVGYFECNICFDLAQDPVITLCGHLHCWPCLYKWLQRARAHECPVCKARIEEEKLIPLYGRGQTSTDTRSKPVPGAEIPSRPAGQRPETAPAPPRPEADDLPVFGRNPGFVPIAPAVLSNFGGVFSPVFSFRFLNANGHDGSSGYYYGYPGSFGDDEDELNRETSQGVERNNENLKKIHFYIFLFVIFALLTM